MTTYDDDTRVVIGVTTGKKDKARGSAKIDSVALTSGTLQKIDTQISGVPILWIANLVLTIQFTATSQGERWAYPGGAIVDILWNGNTSKGSIKAHLRIQPGSNGVLGLDINVTQEHDDRPGNFVREYIAPLFRDAIDNSLEQFTGKPIN